MESGDTFLLVWWCRLHPNVIITMKMGEVYVTHSGNLLILSVQDHCRCIFKNKSTTSPNLGLSFRRPDIKFRPLIVGLAMLSLD
ncbi:hypothetical protein Fmac_006101 [Flemingia macrophylla]|uniref:Uncharacterized protein n=1 Tax=Flemingia macrophylla TaxID=520843 RepID=A0ABD1N9P4_9FABA